MTDARPSRNRGALRSAIENDIAMGRFAPGERLDEATLAARFSVSRTPVREALARLAASGLIEMKPNRGAFVRRIEIVELVEMFEVMSELEATCGRLAAQRLTVQDREALEQAHAICRSAAADAELETYYRANEAFHEAIYRGTGNRTLVAHVVAMRDRLKPYRRLQLRVGRRVRSSFTEHEAILAAILNGDAAAADAALRAHVQVQGERFADFVASIGGSAEPKTDPSG